jgi:hypothetical protein
MNYPEAPDLGDFSVFSRFAYKIYKRLHWSKRRIRRQLDATAKTVDRKFHDARPLKSALHSIWSCPEAVFLQRHFPHGSRIITISKHVLLFSGRYAESEEFEKNSAEFEIKPAGSDESIDALLQTAHRRGRSAMLGARSRLEQNPAAKIQKAEQVWKPG